MESQILALRRISDRVATKTLSTLLVAYRVDVATHCSERKAMCILTAVCKYTRQKKACRGRQWDSNLAA